MANELHFHHGVQNATTYAVIFNAAGQVWNGTTFVAFDTANWADCAVSLAGVGIPELRAMGGWPAAITTPGRYRVEYYIQSGEAPDVTDTLSRTEDVDWNGQARVTIQQILANMMDVESGNDIYAQGESIYGDTQALVSDLTTLLDRLTALRAGKLDNLDAAITTRSAHSAADVAAAVLAGNVSSIGGQSLSLAKAMEVCFAYAAGVASYDSSTGVWTLKGKDGTTTIATVTLSGSGNRTACTLP